MIENNKIVSIRYEAIDKATGDILDSNKDGTPLEFLMGSGQVIAGLEKVLQGAKKGDKLNTTIEAADAYGEYQSDFIQEVPKEQFEGIELKVGMTLFGQGEDGQTVQVIVKDFNDSAVMIDYNHPLAGKTLTFDVEVLDVREPSEVELIQYGSGGCGCGSGGGHGSGGCCGGHGGGCGCGH